eukprot:369542-Pyramimonas_sp.AAC.1
MAQAGSTSVEAPAAVGCLLPCHPPAHPGRTASACGAHGRGLRPVPEAFGSALPDYQQPGAPVGASWRPTRDLERDASSKGSRGVQQDGGVRRLAAGRQPRLSLAARSFPKAAARASQEQPSLPRNAQRVERQ